MRDSIAAPRPLRSLLLASAALLLLTTVPPAAAQSTGRAQAAGVAEIRAGASSPKGDLGDLNDDGVLLGTALGYRILPRVELRAQLDFQNLERGGRPSTLGGTVGPQTHLWHYLAGVQVELTDPVISKWEIALNALGGGTYYDISEGPPAVPDHSGHELTVHFSGQVGYDLFDSATLFARAGGYGMLGDAAEPPTYLGKEFVLTHAGGLRIRF